MTAVSMDSGLATIAIAAKQQADTSTDGEAVYQVMLHSNVVVV